LPKLRGEFAFVLYDSKRETLFVARDRFGIKPLYYTVYEGQLLLASEMKALIPLGWKAEWDVESVMEMGDFYDDRTVFKGVYKVCIQYYSPSILRLLALKLIIADSIALSSSYDNGAQDRKDQYTALLGS
jgi:asparagine synthetase B (glutamine-hydrolysing)